MRAACEGGASGRADVARTDGAGAVPPTRCAEAILVDTISGQSIFGPTIVELFFLLSIHATSFRRDRTSSCQTIQTFCKLHLCKSRGDVCQEIIL